MIWAEEKQTRHKPLTDAEVVSYRNMLTPEQREALDRLYEAVLEANVARQGAQSAGGLVAVGAAAEKQGVSCG
jgi:hypothetical protein